MSIVERPWKVVVHQPHSAEPLYSDGDGRPVFAEWFGPGVISSSRALQAVIDGQTLQINGETPFEQRAQILEQCRGDILSHSPSKPSLGDARSHSTERTDTAGWIISAKAEVFVDGLGSFTPELLQLGPIPVLDSAYSQLPFEFIPDPKEATQCLEVAALNLKESPILRSIKNTSAPISVPAPDGSTLTAVMQLNDMVFEINLDQDERSIVIDRQYDRFHGKQRARVCVWSNAERNLLHDGIWYEPEEDRKNRVANSRYVANLAEPSRCVHLVIAPPSGAPLWSMIRYRFRTYP